MERYIISSKASIAARFHGPGGLEPTTVALELLQKSREFITELHCFMSEFYLESSAQGRDEEAWRPTCKLVHGIFYQFNLVGAVAAQAARISSDEQS